MTKNQYENGTRSPHYGALKEIVDSLFEDLEADDEVRRLDVLMAVESADLPSDLQNIVSLLPPGTYSYERLCLQLNSIINGHAWGQVYGTL